MNTGNRRKFDRSQLTEADQSILTDFSARRQIFDYYLLQHGIKLFTCPGCGYPTLSERGGYEICMVCSWEDDGQDDSTADEVWDGPNGSMSLTENRLGIGELLREKAAEQSGTVNANPSEALHILQHHNETISKLIENAAGQENLEAYQKAIEHLIAALTKR